MTGSRQKLCVLLTLAICTVLAACGGGTDGEASSSAGGTLRVGRAESFDGWVLDSAAAYATYQTHAAVFEPLLRFAPDGTNVEPGLAETWVYDEAAMTWTFTLRSNAKFSDGSPVTSADVVFSYGLWSSGPNFGGSFGQVADVKAVDDRTIAFTMKAPDAVLPSLLSASIAGVLPADFGGRSEKDFYAKPIGAGPYRVTKWSSGGRIELERNPNYYAPDRPKLDKVSIDVVADDSELSRLFEGGELDLVNYVSIASAAQYPEGSLTVTPSSQVFHVSLNATRAPFDDPEVRTAVAAAIDYQSIVDGPLREYGALPTGILAPNLGNWAPPSSDYYSFDLSAAKASLAGSKHADGAEVELIYDAANGTDALLAQIVQANLGEIGITVKLTGLETLAFLDRAFAIDADMTLWSYGAVAPDVSDPLGWIAGTGNLFTGADQTVFDEQRDAYLTTVSPDAKRAAVVAVQDDARSTAAAIALAETPTVHAVGDKLTGFEPAPWGLYYFDTIAKSAG